jgi:hypothetical protein
MSREGWCEVVGEGEMMCPRDVSLSRANEVEMVWQRMKGMLISGF